MKGGVVIRGSPHKEGLGGLERPVCEAEELGIVQFLQPRYQ